MKRKEIMKKILSLLVITSLTLQTTSQIVAISLRETKDKPHELNLYYNRNNSKNNEKVNGDIVYNNWGLNGGKWQLWHTFNINYNNPITYKRIEFLGNEKDFYSKISWGDSAYYGKTLNRYNGPYNDNTINKKMINAKIIDPNFDVPRLIRNESRFFVQSLYTNYNWAYISATQLFALTWYYENNNFYIQVFTYYWVRVTLSLVYGATWMGIGTGIKLYNY